MPDPETPRRATFLKVRMDHLFRMTTQVGMLQHSRFSVPDPRHGYTTDDNARALLVLAWYASRSGDRSLFAPAESCMRFLERAQLQDGWFRNYTDSRGSFVDSRGSDDCLGRAFWACCLLAALRPWTDMAPRAEQLAVGSLRALTEMTYPRGMAYAALGLEHLVRAGIRADEARESLRWCGNSLARALERCSDSRWRWFEERMTYANAILPAGLASAGLALKDGEFVELAKSSMSFLLSVTWQGGKFKLVGNRGWYPKGGSPAEYDEQPVDAGYLALAGLKLFQATGDRSYQDVADHALEWFFGANSQGAWLYEPKTGGCYDGLTPVGVNLNQGAESLLALHIAVLSAQEARDASKKRVIAV